MLKMESGSFYSGFFSVRPLDFLKLLHLILNDISGRVQDSELVVSQRVISWFRLCFAMGQIAREEGR